MINNFSSILGLKDNLKSARKPSGTRETEQRLSDKLVILNLKVTSTVEPQKSGNLERDHKSSNMEIIFVLREIS